MAERTDDIRASAPKSRTGWPEGKQTANRNSARLGAYFLDKLNTLESRHIKEIRGRGLWIGLELMRDAGGARRFCEALQKKGLLCKETHEDTIRFAPPLVIKKDELDWAFDQVAAVFRELD